MTIQSTTDDLIAEIEAEIKHAKESCFEQWLERNTPSGDASDVTAQWEASSELADLLERYRYVIAPVERVRELERWKAEHAQVMGAVLDYAGSLGIAKLGDNLVQVLIHDHARLRELEQAQRWVSVKERLPEEGQDVIVKQVGFCRSYFAGVVCSKPGFMRVKNPVTGDWYRGFKEWKPVQ